MKYYYYCAYGSNLNMDQMKWRCSDAMPVCAEILKDYKLVCNNFYSVEKKKGENVFVGIWKISEREKKIF